MRRAVLLAHTTLEATGEVGLTILLSIAGALWAAAALRAWLWEMPASRER